MITGERHLAAVLTEYVRHHNEHRPHQALDQRSPNSPSRPGNLDAQRIRRTGKGNPWLAATIGESVAAVSRTDTFLGERYRRLVRRRGKKRAIVAVGNSMLTIIWHLLSDPDARYHDLGPGHYESKINKQRRQRDLVRQLEHLTGHKVILQPHPSYPPPPDRRLTTT